MSLEEQDMIVNMLRDRFNAVDAKLESMSSAFDDHVKIDAEYWKKIDQQEAQINMLKWLTSGGAGTAVLAWVYQTFHK